MTSITTTTTTPSISTGLIARRAGWFAASAGAVAAGVAEVAGGGTPWWVLALFAVGPDLSFLAAMGAGPVAKGQLPARAVPVYNLAHRPVWPMLVAAAAVADVAPRSFLVAGLGWFAHIALDRSVGYGLRTPDGRQRG